MTASILKQAVPIAIVGAVCAAAGLPPLVSFHCLALLLAAGSLQNSYIRSENFRRRTEDILRRTRSDSLLVRRYRDAIQRMTLPVSVMGSDIRAMQMRPCHDRDMERILSRLSASHCQVSSLVAGLCRDEGLRYPGDADTSFVRLVEDTLHRNLDKPGYGAAQLARDMGMSYSGFHTRMRSLTGLSPGEFVTAYRMSVSAALLCSHRYTVSQVADMVGASSAANFSRTFRRHFGTSPGSLFR